MAQGQITVYTGGSINGHSSLNFPNGWRSIVEQELEPLGIRVLNPLRGRKHDDTNSIEIVERDLADIEESDILLIEMSYENRAYIGTAMEIRVAWLKGKVIIIWGIANVGSHWLRYHTCKGNPYSTWFSTLEDAIKYIKKLGGAKLDGSKDSGTPAGTQ